jgi:hypothetical protein
MTGGPRQTLPGKIDPPGFQTGTTRLSCEGAHEGRSAVPLSEHEQRLLEQMERALYAEDPKFATSLRSASAGKASRGRAALGVLVLLGGVTFLMLGAILPLIPLGVAGFVIMIIGATLTYLGLRGGSAPATAAAEGEAAPGADAGPAPRRAPKQSSGFMDRLEDRWRKRRDEGPQQ